MSSKPEHQHDRPPSPVPTMQGAAPPPPDSTPPPPLQVPKTRSPPPPNFKLPSSPFHHRSPSAAAQDKPTTPTSAESYSQSIPMSSFASGPISPSANLGSSSFVFPMRSVFQGMVPSSSNQSISSSGEGANLSRAGSRGAQSGRSPTQADSRRFSQPAVYSTEDEHDDDDMGVQTIAQMLQQGSSASRQRHSPAVATFSGKTDRHVSDQHRVPAYTGGTDSSVDITAPQGFFSMPNIGKESTDNPFFAESRRASEGVDHDVNPEGQSKHDASRQLGPNTSGPKATNPSAEAEGSGLPNKARAPVGQPRSQPTGINFSDRPGPSNTPGNKPTNPSAEAEGSGLPNKDHAPVGQPQRQPAGINFRHRPGPGRATGEETSFSTDPVDENPAGSTTSSTGRGPSTTGGRSSGQYSDIKSPQPRSIHAGGLGAFTASNASTGRSRTTGSFVTALETDKDGERALVSDLSGIVRLTQPGALSATSATGHDNVAVSSATASTGPTDFRLANQQREMTKTASARDSVRDFVNEQAHMVNMTDPNAPTPSPAPNAADQTDRISRASRFPGEGRDSVVAEDSGQSRQDWGGSAESSLDVASSEAATASSSGAPIEEEAQSSAGEPPIITFRFEHTQTSDGHHMVMGREGSLRTCEDEPITTPGAVQGFGVLLVLDEDFESGSLSVRQVSENSTELLGLSPRYLFRLDCFSRILTTDQEDVLRDNIEYLPDTESGKGSVEEEGPQVFLLSGYGEPGSDDTEEDEENGAGRRREWTCWVAAHRPKQATSDKTDEQGRPVPPPNLIVLEFELERDIYNPLMQTFEPPVFSSGAGTPDSESHKATSADGSASTGSTGNKSEGSVTTVGTAPHRRASDMTTPTERPSLPGSGSTTRETSFTSRDSKVPPEMQAQGLDGVEVEMPLSRIIESTTNHARPLRALERMRRTGQHGPEGPDSGSGSNSRGGRSRRAQRRPPPGTTGTMDVFAVLGQINEQLGSAPDLETFLKITVGVVQDLCRFHRVLLYQFDENYNGQVVAELVEWGKTTDLFKGLMFPAADIPAQARKLYMINKVRLLYDRSQTTARMVLKSKEDLDNPLDMTHCYLRAMSPIHIKYLANMQVRSSMSVSIMAFGQLWGLIACHGYGHHGMRVSFPVRQMLRILSDSISRNIERLSYAQRLHTRKLISTIPTQSHPTGYIVSNADDLLQIFDADAGLLVIGDGCKLLGNNNEQGQAMLAIAEFLRIIKFTDLKASNHLNSDFPELVLPRGPDTIAGLLYVPLTAKAGQDFIVFLRKGQAREVQWAGKPYKDETTGDAASLEPRKSFKTWSETVTGRSRAWSDDQLESAGVLALIYGKFIQVWREKQTAMASNQLTAILLSNTSHAVRTPLSQIINTLELALAGNIDADTRSMLENSHQASRALLFHVHDLLDLTRIETGNETAFNDPFDLRKSINDAVRLYQTESTRRGLDFRVVMGDDLPQQVIGDSRKIKTVISNLAANSVKFTDTGYIEVYCGLQQGVTGQEVARQSYVPIEIVVSDSGGGIPTDKLEAMFVTLEGADEERTESTGLGLGLAVVARIVEQLAGQLRAESEVGVGTRFFFTLQMLKYDGQPISQTSSVNSVAAKPETRSSGSGSVVSRRSHGTHTSEIDTFVQDFGASHMLGGPVELDDQRLKDADSRMNQPGTFPVTDSSWPVRPTKMEGEADQSANTLNTSPRPAAPVRPPSSPNFKRAISAFGPTRRMAPRQATQMSSPSLTSHEQLRDKRGPKGEQKLKVLVVEDDMINSQILQRRLRMDKHSVIAVTNGQEAVDAIKADWDIDAVLMDIQMPIMDGRMAAQEIRKLESKLDPRFDIDPLRIDGRVPIFAVSASLYESDRSDLATNFDGWLLKPLDFSRVRALFAGLEDQTKRSSEVYVNGQWEKGGYLRDAPRETA